MIKVKLSSVDGFIQTKSFNTIEAAREFAVKYVGKSPDFSSKYAISDDGIAKAEVEGCTIRELFEDFKAELPFHIYVGTVNEDTGACPLYSAASFATLDEAKAAQETDAFHAYDEVKIVGTTPEANAEITLWRIKWNEEIAAEDEKNYPDGIPF